MLKLKTVIAIVLIVVGIAGFVYQGIQFMSDAPMPSGPHRMPLPPVIGLLALIAGIAMLLVGDGDSRHRLAEHDRRGAPGRRVTVARRR